MYIQYILIYNNVLPKEKYLQLPQKSWASQRQSFEYDLGCCRGKVHQAWSNSDFRCRKQFLLQFTLTKSCMFIHMYMIYIYNIKYIEYIDMENRIKLYIYTVINNQTSQTNHFVMIICTYETYWSQTAHRWIPRIGWKSVHLGLQIGP